jgi:hypothetical protein
MLVQSWTWSLLLSTLTMRKWLTISSMTAGTRRWQTARCRRKACKGKHTTYISVGSTPVGCRASNHPW